MTAQALRFDAATHTYTLVPSGIRLPCVSDILRPLVNFDNVPNGVLEFARDRGHAVHKACELHDMGTLDEGSLDPRIVPYLDAWKRFRDETGFEPETIELPGYHKQMMYAGTPDRTGWIGDRYVVVDIKATAVTPPSVAVQLTAYDHMLGSKADELISVRLDKDGRPEYKAHKKCLPTWMSCYNIFMWLQKNS